MPDAQIGAWPADAWASYGGGGGSITDLTAPAAIDPVALVAGTTALASTAIGSWSASVTVTAAGTDDTGSAAPTLSLSGSGAGPYSATIASGLVSGRTYTYDIEGDDGAGQIARTSLTVSVAAAASGAAWTSVRSTDFTTDITDLTLTVGGGDTTLYEADGVTPKATVGAVQRLGTAGVARVTAADGGGYVEQAGSGRAITFYERLDLSALLVDPTDPSTVILVSIVVTGQTFAQNGDGIVVRLISDPNPNAGTSYGFGMQQLRVSGTSYIRRGIQIISGTGSVGVNKDSQTSARADTVVTFKIEGGRVADVFSTPGTTPDTGVPTVGGTVIKSDQSTTDTIENGATIDQTTDMYVHVEAFSNGGGTVSAVVEGIHLSTLTLP